MKDKITKYILVILLCTGYCDLQAQYSVVSASNNVSGIGGTESYTVGQVAWLTVTGIDGTITEGVQQPFEIILMEGIEEGNGILLECKVYPNPTTAFVSLSIKNKDLKNLSYQLYNTVGSLLQNERITQSETVIPMENLKQGDYFITISEHTIALKTFKIIKK